jgi:hypothetical protein
LILHLSCALRRQDAGQVLRSLPLHIFGACPGKGGRRLKTFLYIDGFNLYYGAVKDAPLKWLNPVALAARAFPRNQILATKYFTAKVGALLHDPDKPNRQMIFWRALRTLPQLEIILGDFRTRRVRAGNVLPLC